MVVARCECGLAFDEVTFPRLDGARIVIDGSSMYEVRTCKCGKEVRASKTPPKLAKYIPPPDGQPHIGASALALMRERGGKWAAYQNHDMGHPDLGGLTFLQYGGPTSTYTTPPNRATDGAHGLGWRYLHVGYVDLKSGSIVGTEPAIDQEKV